MSDSVPHTLKVLIADFDLMSGVGGGQTIYRRLIQLSPEIHFTYLRNREPSSQPLPLNVRAMQATPKPDSNRFSTASNEQWIHAFVASEWIAETIGVQDFDVLEIPDYRPEFLMLPESLKRRGVKIGKIVVALHGRISTSVLTDWDNSALAQRNGKLMEVLERLLFDSADIRYGISKSNLDDWKRESSLSCRYLSPLSILERPTHRGLPTDVGQPNLYCIGRTERRKGADLFLEMLWNLPKETYSQAFIVGDAVAGTWGRDSVTMLRQMARSRNLEVSFLPSITPAEMFGVFARRSIVFTPSRVDTLNLVALESLFAGCPTVIGEPAGVCRLLNDDLPDVPYTRFQLNDAVGNAQRVEGLISNYDVARQHLHRAISTMASSVPAPLFNHVYQSPVESCSEVRATIQQRYLEQLQYMNDAGRFSIRRTVKTIKRRISPTSLAHRFRQFRMNWAIACYQFERTKAAGLLDEHDESTRREKIAAYENLVGGERIGRAYIWSNLSRLEQDRGRDLVATTYALRTMRLAQGASDELLTKTTETLIRHGFQQEASLVRLLYGQSAPERRHAQLLDWLHNQKLKQTKNTPATFARVDDRRGAVVPRAAIIVSLYKAASKTKHFLDAMARQTMILRNEAELILVDSGSPEDEYAPIASHPCFLSAPSIYVRTENRETIQQAWNRGLGLCRAPYVCMLGADETIRPDCLDRLATELDRRTQLDWIQADSLVTETDSVGHFDRDLFLYDRRGYRPELVRLETCYLSWVGALYRRNIHDRIGYYDPTFGAAGDTEFKNRVLPYIQTDAYPQTLGVFWNYPEIRTTQHPRAEIEDYRAWHVFRTSAGVEYAHAQSTPEQILRAAQDALSYRRSYTHSTSTDLEYACELLRYAIRRDPSCFPQSLMKRFEIALRDFRMLDQAPWRSLAARTWACRKIFSRLNKLNREIVSQFPSQPQLMYFNDERCEHINWCWSYLT